MYQSHPQTHVSKSLEDTGLIEAQRVSGAHFVKRLDAVAVHHKCIRLAVNLALKLSMRAVVPAKISETSGPSQQNAHPQKHLRRADGMPSALPLPGLPDSHEHVGHVLACIAQSTRISTHLRIPSAM